jgi:ATP-dependent Clp protease ATP-binding subunit ClpA
MFERFTEKAINVIMLAQEEAKRLGHNFVGTEQILLGLIGEGTGIGAKALKSFGVNLKDARAVVEKIIHRGSGYVAAEIPFTPRAKRVLELSWEEARQLGHNFIGTEHLLLGIIREGEGVAARVLEQLGVDLTKVRRQVIRLLGEAGIDLTAKPVERQISPLAPPKGALDLLLKRIVRLLHVAEDRAASISKPELADLLKKHSADLSNELESLGFSLPKKVPTAPLVDPNPESVANQIMRLAQEEARRLRHNFVGTEQLLLGLIGEGSGIAAKVLESFGIKLENTRAEVEQIIGRGSGFVAVEIPFTPRAKRVLELSWDEARQLGSNNLGGEHLLLGLLREDRGVAVEVLDKLGVDRKELEQRVHMAIQNTWPA